MNILGWPHYHILEVTEHEYNYQITAEQDAVSLCCPHCAAPSLYRHEIKHQLFMDIPIRGKRTGIIVVRKRYRCRACNKTFFEPLHDMNEHHMMTKRLILYIARESLKRTFASIADDTGLDERTIRRIFQEASKTTEASMIESTCIGIDELYLLNQYRCIITDIEHHQIIDLLRDRKKATVIKYLQGLEDSTKEQITVVCTDMWSSYHDAVREVLPHAHLVVDKFHVLQLLSGCLEHVRRRVRKSLTDKQRRTLMHDRYLLLRRAHDLDEHEKLVVEAWLENFPQLKTAYHLKESFYIIYKAETKEIALERYFDWFGQITLDIYDCFLPLTMAIEHYGEAIFNYFTYRYTAGYTECLNGQIKLAQRTGRGYSFEVLRARVLQNGSLRCLVRPPYRERKPLQADVLAHDAALSPLASQELQRAEKPGRAN